MLIASGCQVYGLFSTENGVIRYIGQTTKSVAHRRKLHLKTALEGGQWPLSKWIRKTLGKGFTLEAVVLVQNAEWNTTEIKMIAAYKANGANLLNATDGGEGFVGMKRTAAQCRKMSIAAKRRSETPEGRKHLSAAGKAFWDKPENTTRRRPRQPQRNRSQAARERARENPEQFQRFRKSGAQARGCGTRKKISAVVKEQWQSPEYRAKILAGHARYWTPERRAEQAERARNQKHVSHR